jgi:hypothetical protein
VRRLWSGSKCQKGGRLGKGLASASPRHCEERSDEAIQKPHASTSGLLRFPRNDGSEGGKPSLFHGVVILHQRNIAMTPEERRLELDKDRPDPDYEAHEETYFGFTRIVKYAAFAFPFFFAFVIYWTD